MVNRIVGAGINCATTGIIADTCVVVTASAESYRIRRRVLRIDRIANDGHIVTDCLDAIHRIRGIHAVSHGRMIRAIKRDACVGAFQHPAVCYRAMGRRAEEGNCGYIRILHDKVRDGHNRDGGSA